MTETENHYRGSGFLDDQIRSRVSPDSIVHVEEQQTNDADKAIKYCLEKGAKSVHLLGAAGKRLDQLLAIWK